MLAKVLSAALFGEVTVDNGIVSQSNFGDYRLLRIDEAPRIDVHFIPSTAAPRRERMRVFMRRTRLFGSVGQ